MDWVSPPPPLNSASNYESKISPSILLIILILAVIFFISGILHLLVRLLLRPRAREAEDLGDGTALQGQLQELFHLHDAGVDQSFIDTLPVFLYSAIVGLKDPFDCAVCLSGFEAEDKLRLLPSCSHAFHVECIDTWLFSHSTCPLCRRSLFESGSQSSRDFLASDEKFVSVELGKFRGAGEGSSCGDGNLEDGGRRCFSMGSFDYVLEQSCGLQVSFASIKKKKQESLSVSKIWLQPGRPSCSSSRRAFSFRLPLRRVLDEEATTDRIDYFGEECGSEVDLDVEVGSCDNRFCSQIEEKTPSFARRTLLRIAGR